LNLGDTIKKAIDVDENNYFERDLNIKTIENRTILLPKTEKGKPKKLSISGILSYSPFGVAFVFSGNFLCIYNISSNTEFHSERFSTDKGNLDILKSWLERWIRETTEKDLLEIEAYKNKKRKHCKFQEGDFFAFKIDRRNYGFGRILLDVFKRKKIDKLENNKNYGLTSFMGRALIVKIYHKISSSIDVNLDELSSLNALPSHAVMDNGFYYGQYVIIGNSPLKIEEYDMLISCCSNSYNSTIYMQYGFIFKEIEISAFREFLSIEAKHNRGLSAKDPFRKESLNFYLDLDVKVLKECILEKSNMPYWKSKRFDIVNDLRNPSNFETRKKIFNAFGLDANKTYEFNLQQLQNASR